MQERVNNIQEIQDGQLEAKPIPVELFSIDGVNEVSASLEKIESALVHDQSLAQKDLTAIEEALRQTKVNFFGDEMTLEQIRSIPDLQNNLRIFQEVLSGETKNVQELTVLPLAIARSLARRNYQYLHLSNVGQISVPAAAALADLRVEDYLSIGTDSGLRPSPEVLQALSKFQGKNLAISIPELIPEIAEILNQFKCELSLTNVRDLTPEAAQILSMRESNLVLTGFDSLTPEAAAYLGKHKGQLYLDSLTSLSDEAAKLLSSHEGDLSFFSLMDISDKALEYLKKLKGKIFLSGVDAIPVEKIQEYLRAKRT